jgi:hypothetical protein
VSVPGSSVVVVSPVVGATVVGPLVVGPLVVGAPVVGAPVVGATVVGPSVVGASVVDLLQPTKTTAKIINKNKPINFFVKFILFLLKYLNISYLYYITKIF